MNNDHFARRLLSIAPLLALLVTWIALSSCRNGSATAGQPDAAAVDEPVELRYLATPGTVIPLELAEDLGYLAPLKLVYVSSTTGGPQSIQTVVTGDVDVGSSFNGAILKLIAAKAPIKAVLGSYGTNEQTWAGYYVTESSPIRTARDLLGKKVAMNTIGAHHEFVLKEYLRRNGFTPEQTRQVMLVALPPVNAEQTLRQGQTDVSVLSGIYRDRALQRGGLRLLFSDQQLFGSFTAGSHVMRTDFIAKRPKTARKFVEGVGKALEWSRVTPRDEVISRFRAILTKRGRNEDANLASYWHSYGVAGKNGLIHPRDFQIWIDWMVKAGELRSGQLELSAVYTNELNPTEQRAP